MLVYDNNLNNQHMLTWKFAGRWFRLYVLTSANDNATYHLLELDGTRISISVAGKRIKAFKKRHESEPEPEVEEDEEANENEDPNEDPKGDISEEDE